MTSQTASNSVAFRYRIPFEAPEIVRRELPGAELALAQLGHCRPPLGRVEVGQVPGRPDAAPGHRVAVEQRQAGGSARGGWAADWKARHANPQCFMPTALLGEPGCATTGRPGRATRARRTPPEPRE